MVCVCINVMHYFFISRFDGKRAKVYRLQHQGSNKQTNNKYE